MDCFTIESFLSLIALISLEIVLGIDNVVFISLSVASLHGKEREQARIVGLLIAMLSRILILFLGYYLLYLEINLFELFNQSFTTKNIIYLLFGGFLIIKGVSEIYDIKFHRYFKLIKRETNFKQVVIQLSFVSIILSFDSVATAIGMTQHIAIAMIAIFITVMLMIFSTRRLSEFIYNNLSMKLLCLGILTIIGILMVCNGFGLAINHTSLYFAIFFSISIEVLKLFILREPSGNV